MVLKTFNKVHVIEVEVEKSPFLGMGCFSESFQDAEQTLISRTNQLVVSKEGVEW